MLYSSTQRAAAITTASRRAITTAAIKATCCGSSFASSIGSGTSLQINLQQKRTKASAVPDHNPNHGATSVGAYNFASTGYADCFRDLPKPNTDALRASALAYLEKFDKKKWYDDPVSLAVLYGLLNLLKGMVDFATHDVQERYVFAKKFLQLTRSNFY